MPPKRTRAAGSSQPISSSQPETQRPTRTSARNRRDSDGSNASESVTSSQVKETPAKRGRPKKTKAKVDTEVIFEEEEDMMVATERTTPKCDGPTEAGNISGEDEIEVCQTTSMHVRFGAETEEHTVEKSTATNITPHPRKMSIKRRRSDSPATDGSVKRVKSSRTSLPAGLALGEPTQIIREHLFRPLRTVLLERIRRISGVTGEILQTRSRAQLDGPADAGDDDIMVLDTHDQISVPQLPSAPQTPVQHHTISEQTATPGAYDRSQWAAERKSLQDAIVALKKEADEATTTLRIHDIELDSLGFAEVGTPSLEVLQSIRESYAQAREFLETELPHSLPEGASNKDLTEILVANVTEFANRLRTADQELGEKDELINDLSGQIHDIVDHLAKKEIETKANQDEIELVRESAEEREYEIVELKNDLEAADNEREDVDKALLDETARAKELADEKFDLEKNLERLSASLQNYQNEETKLSDRINKMEEEHRNTVAAMNKEREETFRDLEDRLDDESSCRNEADVLAEERQKIVEKLQLDIDATEADRDSLQIQLETITAQKDEHKEKRQAAEDELEEKDSEIEDLEFRVRRLEEQLDDYKEQLDDLRQLTESERTQREAAEADLDEVNKTVEELNEKLHEQGQQANELRQKLFEVQTINEQTIKELETAASERDQQYQDDMAVEVSRREAAETSARDHAATVQGLKAQLGEIEQQMRDTLAARDDQVNVLKSEAMQKDAELQTLRDEMATATEGSRAAQEDQEDYIQDLSDDLADLKQTVVEHETTIENMEQDAKDIAREHQTQIEQRDTTITLLDSELAVLKASKEDLEKDKAALERKVQDEAEFLLGFQNEKNAEVDELKQAIRDKQNKIQAVEEKVHETDRRWQDVLIARDEEVLALTTTTETQAQAIDNLRSRFSEYVRRSSGFIERLQEQVDATKVLVDEEGAGLQEDGDELLIELQALEVPKGMPNGIVKKTKTTKTTKRQYDSAIGMASPYGLMLS